MFGLEVNKGTRGSVCAAGEECQPGTEASTRGAFENPRWLAVDNSPEGEGDVYVYDVGIDYVQKFDSTGHLITTWAESGRLRNGEGWGMDVSPTGDLVIKGIEGIGVYDPAGHSLYGEFAFAPYDFSPSAWKFDSHGNGYSMNIEGIWENPSSGLAKVAGTNEEAPVEQVTTTVGYGGFALDLSNSDIYADTGSEIDHFTAGCKRVCQPIDSFGAGHLFGGYGAAVDAASHIVYVPNSETGDVAVFAPVLPNATTGPATEIGETSAVLTGGVEPAGYGDLPLTECYFEYGTTEAYGGATLPCQPTPSVASPFESPTSVRATISGLPPITGLPPGTRYHYRLVTANTAGGTGLGSDRTFVTTSLPDVRGTLPSHLTGTSAQLEGKVNPDGVDTTYHFEYGPTTSYDESTTSTDLGSSQISQRIRVPITGLKSGVTYHFRLIAHNALGTSTSDDQTFEFLPPDCPNQAVRQQTGSAYLPDCRAYELVSPPNANGTLLYAGGPNTGLATNPPRFAYTGLYGAFSGTNPINTAGDLYVATRTDTGWTSRYVGLPGDQAGCMGGPPDEPLSRYVFLNPPDLTNTVPSDPNMERFLLWRDGTPAECFAEFGDRGSGAPASNAPYMFNADGSLAKRLPTDLPGESGALESALSCPYPTAKYADEVPACTSEVAASPDLHHFVFSSRVASFSGPPQPAGLYLSPRFGLRRRTCLGAGFHHLHYSARRRHPPRSRICDRSSHRQSKWQGWVTGGAEESLHFPAISADGSHILISTATAGTPTCSGGGNLDEVCPRFTATPVHLYMRVNDLITYEIAGGKPVTFVGMTPDGSKVFFTSEEHLTSEDPGHGGASIYMWSEASNSLTLVSKGETEGPGAPGNTGNCHPALRANFTSNGQPMGEAPWTTGCSAIPISTYAYSWLTGGAGGNDVSDSAIAANGDIYFYSPEQLDGAKGVSGQENLYDYRSGSPRYVATLKPEDRCTSTAVLGKATVCTPESVLRIEVNREDTHMALVTASQLTSSETVGHLEMYTYTPSTGALHCVSCNPDGEPATADVQASQDGRFITEDGRTFFSTTESLVSQDTNKGPDVYEFVDGRPQLITSGTGSASAGSAALSFAASNELPGLVGVSANGADVYVGTFDSLTSEDHNGNFFKFYDARTDGGFAQTAPTPPCEAGEECHGPGTQAPALPTQGTAATLTGGNATPERHAKHHKKHKRKGKRHHRRANTNREGGK